MPANQLSWLLWSRFSRAKVHQCNNRHVFVNKYRMLLVYNPGKWFNSQMEICICIGCNQGEPRLIHCTGKHDFATWVPHISEDLLPEGEMQDQA